MRIMVIGATGLLGTPVAQALELNHEVLRTSLNGSALQVDSADPGSIRNLYAKVGQVDAVVSVAGQAVFRPVWLSAWLTPELKPPHAPRRWSFRAVCASVRSLQVGFVRRFL